MAKSDYTPTPTTPMQKLGGFDTPQPVPMSREMKYPKPRKERVLDIQSSASGGIVGAYQSVNGLFVTATRQFYVRFTANKNGYVIAPDGAIIYAQQVGGYSVIEYVCAQYGVYSLFIDSTATKIEFQSATKKSQFNAAYVEINFFGEIVFPSTESTILYLKANNCTKLTCSWLNMETLEALNATWIDCSVNDLVSVNAPKCQTFNSFSTGHLPSLDLPEGLSVNCSYNADLLALTAPKATSINATACKFTAQAIETLLVSLVVTGNNNGTINLTGSNMAGLSTWTSNAVTAKNTLVSRGWAITYKA